MTTLLSGGGTRGRGPLADDVDLARDRELVARAQAGDRSAFDDLYQRYYGRLYRFCLRRLHDPHEAEDVTQDAFARAWRALPAFAGDRRFYPWLSVIAAHRCTDVLRRRNRAMPVAEFHQGDMASTDDGGEEIALAAVDSAIVAQAFTRLSHRHQRVLHLREASGWSYQRIADHEGVGITAVETLLWRARQALRREFALIAGPDGHLAGVLGGVLSLAALRRLLRRAVHRMALSGPRAVALTSLASAAATAVVMTAVVSGIGSPAPSRLPASTGTAGSRTPNAAPAHDTHTVGARSVGPGGTTRGVAGQGAATGGSSLPGGGSSAGQLADAPGADSADATGGAGTTLGTLGSLVGGVSSTLGASVTGAGTTVSGTLSTLPVVGGTLGATVGAALTDGTTTAGTALSGTGSDDTGSPSKSSTGSSGPLSSITEIVGGL